MFLKMFLSRESSHSCLEKKKNLEKCTSKRFDMEKIAELNINTDILKKMRAWLA